MVLDILTAAPSFGQVIIKRAGPRFGTPIKRPTGG